MNRSGETEQRGEQDGFHGSYLINPGIRPGSWWS